MKIILKGPLEINKDERYNDKNRELAYNWFKINKMASLGKEGR